MSAGSHDDHLDLIADKRSLERRRLFKNHVVLPVSLGMVTTFVVYSGRDLVVHFSGQAWPFDVPDWAYFAITLAIGLGVLQLIRR